MSGSGTILAILHQVSLLNIRNNNMHCSRVVAGADRLPWSQWHVGVSLCSLSSTSKLSLVKEQAQVSTLKKMGPCRLTWR